MWVFNEKNFGPISCLGTHPYASKCDTRWLRTSSMMFWPTFYQSWTKTAGLVQAHFHDQTPWREYHHRFYISLFKISHLNKVFEMQRMQLSVGRLPNFSTFPSSAASSCLLFISLGKCGVKLLHIKIFRFYKVFISACTTKAVSTSASMNWAWGLSSVLAVSLNVLRKRINNLYIVKVVP